MKRLSENDSMTPNMQITGPVDFVLFFSRSLGI